MLDEREARQALVSCRVLAPHLFLLAGYAQTGGDATTPTGSACSATGRHASAFKEKPNNPHKHESNETKINTAKDIHRSEDRSIS
jgi:hypothetical protein